MYKYTMNPDADGIVEGDMEKLRNLGISPFALVLFGSFGRGEGLVLNGMPRNDYDLLLVHGTEEDKKKIQTASLLGMPEIHMIDLEDVKNSTATQQWYEIRYASHLILGEDINGVIGEIKPYEIPYFDAIQSLERRCTSMLVAKYEMMKDKPDMRKIAEQIIKMVIAIGDATLIKRGQFHPKYAYRNLMLTNDEIAPQYSLAVTAKLTGMPIFNEDQLWGWWHNTRKRLREYVVENQLKLVIGEALFAVTDRTEKKQLKEILMKLGAEQWLGGDDDESKVNEKPSSN